MTLDDKLKQLAAEALNIADALEHCTDTTPLSYLRGCGRALRRHAHEALKQSDISPTSVEETT